MFYVSCLFVFFWGGGVKALKGREREREKFYKFIPKIYDLVLSLFNFKAGFCIIQPALDDHPVQN